MLLFALPCRDQVGILGLKAEVTVVAGHSVLKIGEFNALQEFLKGLTPLLELDEELLGVTSGLRT